ncbi:MAG: glycoside hydrolase family 32 protein, partial [Clostridia bacterium]|nr:glycoside hydrolase family 32 protein [Clostridia bacterium]
SMHWGHATSRDFLHWDYLPVALAPDQSYDYMGCFSGSAIESEDGKHVLMYTSVRMAPDMQDGGIGVQTQSIAIGDGIDYEKYSGNPVLTETDLPEGGSRYDFRDPKVWKASDGSYVCAVANRAADNTGAILLYKSTDLFHWKYWKVLAANRGRFGMMWECPDFFELDGKYVLLGSSQDMLPKGLEYQNGNGTFYFTGTYDEETETFFEEADHTVDYGIDFYAPQTVLAPDGRRIMIGWMQNWDTCNLHTESTPWFGQMSIPRELSLKDGILYQTPIRELEELRCDEVVYDEVVLDSEEKELDGIDGRMLDLTVEIEPVDPEVSYRRFGIRFAKDDEFYTEVRFRRKESTLKIDRMYSGSRRAIIHQRKALVSHDNGALKLRLILDRFSAEVFVNDGEKVMSTTLETDLAADRIAFLADGAVRLKITKYTLAT